MQPIDSPCTHSTHSTHSTIAACNQLRATTANLLADILPRDSYTPHSTFAGHDLLRVGANRHDGVTVILLDRGDSYCQRYVTGYVAGSLREATEWDSGHYTASYHVASQDFFARILA